MIWNYLYWRLGQGNERCAYRLTNETSLSDVSLIIVGGIREAGSTVVGGRDVPKDYRLKIKMDGVLTTEIDFSGLHIVILYAQEGINYWADVNDDPYELHRINDIDPEIDLRAAAKLLLLTAINAETETKAFGAFREQAETGTLEKRLKNEQLSQILFHLK